MVNQALTMKIADWSKEKKKEEEEKEKEEKARDRSIPDGSDNFFCSVAPPLNPHLSIWTINGDVLNMDLRDLR